MYYIKNIIVLAVSTALYWQFILSLKVIPERAMRIYANEKYLFPNTTINVRRYSRKSGYYINMAATLKTQFGNNVSLHLIFFEFLHNEYKRSFVEMKFNRICDEINRDPYIGKAFRQVGVPCPVPKGYISIMNVSVPADDFPNVWPYERCKVEATLLQNQNGDVICSADIFLLFKQKQRLK